MGKGRDLLESEEEVRIVARRGCRHWRGHMREISVKHYRAKSTDKITEIVQGLPEVPQ